MFAAWTGRRRTGFVVPGRDELVRRARPAGRANTQLMPQENVLSLSHAYD